MVDFVMKAGDTRQIELTVYDDAGAPLDLTDATIVWEAGYMTAFATTPIITKTLGNGITVLGDPAEGVIEITLLQADTAALRGAMRYETKITDGFGRPSHVGFPETGNVERYYGTFQIEPQYIAASS